MPSTLINELKIWNNAYELNKIVAVASHRATCGRCRRDGQSLLGYRYDSRTVTLTIAVGSIDGEAAKAMSAIAGRLASMKARSTLPDRRNPRRRHEPGASLAAVLRIQS